MSGYVAALSLNVKFGNTSRRNLPRDVPFTSEFHQAAIDCDGLTGNETGVVAGEKCHRPPKRSPTPLVPETPRMTRQSSTKYPVGADRSLSAMYLDGPSTRAHPFNLYKASPIGKDRMG